MPRRTKVPITPSVLAWTIRQSGLNDLEVANNVKVDISTLESWKTGEDQPKLTEFKKLSQLLKRPTAFFLLPEPPASALPEVQFRHPIDSTRNRPNVNELQFLRETARLQKALSWIRKEIEEAIVTPPSVIDDIDVEIIATAIREWLGISSHTQFGWKTSSEALEGWRHSLEALGAYVFLFPMGRDSSRGFFLWDDYAPVIAVNTHWNVESRIFTIFHELGHLMTRSNSVCLNPARQLNIEGGDSLERWCERLAASILMPNDDVMEFLNEQLKWNEGESITNLDDVRGFTRKFKVSLRAATLRLITVGAANWSLYSEIPAWSDDKSQGGGGSGRSRRKMRQDWYGHGTSSTFLAALDEELMTRGDVLTYLNISDADLYEIQIES